MARMSNSWAMLKASATVLRLDSELLIFPLLSTLAVILITVPLVAMIMGAKVNAVPAVEHGHDLPAMLEAITPATRIVWVANPNNPTGTLAKPTDVRTLVEQVPDDVLLVMDEAYYEFLDEPVDDPDSWEKAMVKGPAASAMLDGTAAALADCPCPTWYLPTKPVA